MANLPTKIIFAGTPEFAVPFLAELANDADFEIVAIITQPDKPAGRKQLLAPPPVKVWASSRGFTIFQPEKLTANHQIINELKALSADVLVVVAYGLIIPPEILAIFARGNINVHPSLLPKYRGASPVQAAILAGENHSGVTIMLMDEKMDHGPILAQEELILSGNETNESLHQLMATVGKKLLVKTIKKYLVGQLTPQPQDHQQATFCKEIKKEDARIDWSKSALSISRQIRAYYPWPIAWSLLDGRRVKIFPPVDIGISDKKPGEIFQWQGQLAIGAGDNQALLPMFIQLEGKNKKPAEYFISDNNGIGGKIFS
ncbi:MAG TPA: methionyl-tRNA formyltransferase [bacterium]|nr:methionyl-tRNA formyltransferase [bacterium]HNS33773.1 methionyl-tRNA formyltransferase [bacterium]HNZ73714.1 methionyl-tRNA formyltransferase [bacterium]HOH67606.1 methionyl-tRNA formyltransferase [bacterium]